MVCVAAAFSVTATAGFASRRSHAAVFSVSVSCSVTAQRALRAPRL